MKRTLLLFWCLILAASAFAEAPGVEFAEGRVHKFSTANHPKAKGVVFTIAYPASWAAKEGERPNIVQTFVSEGGKGLEMALITTKALPPEVPISQADISELLSPEALREWMPEEAAFLGARRTRIENEPAGILEYSIRQERAGATLDMHTMVLAFVQGRTLTQVQFQVGGLPSSDVSGRFEVFRPLWLQMMNSVVFTDKWK